MLLWHGTCLHGILCLNMGIPRRGGRWLWCLLLEIVLYTYGCTNAWKIMHLDLPKNQDIVVKSSLIPGFLLLFCLVSKILPPLQWIYVSCLDWQAAQTKELVKYCFSTSFSVGVYFASARGSEHPLKTGLVPALSDFLIDESILPGFHQTHFYHIPPCTCDLLRLCAI